MIDALLTLQLINQSWRDDSCMWEKNLIWYTKVNELHLKMSFKAAVLEIYANERVYVCVCPMTSSAIVVKRG